MAPFRNNPLRNLPRRPDDEEEPQEFQPPSVAADTYRALTEGAVNLWRQERGRAQMSNQQRARIDKPLDKEKVTPQEMGFEPEQPQQEPRQRPSYMAAGFAGTGGQPQGRQPQDDEPRQENGRDLNEFNPDAPTINDTPNVFNQAGVTGQQPSTPRTRPRGGQSGQTRPQTRGQNQSRQRGAQSRTQDEPSRQSVSIRRRIEQNVGSMGDYLGQQDVQLLPPDATEEDIQAVLDNGGIPVTQPDLSGMEEFVPQPVDFSRSEEALRQFAEAKVNAAKQGALMSEQGARNANTRLLANAFGPGLFQALSGVQQPTNQQTNYNFQAARRMEQANQAQQRAIETGFTAPAQAEVQASQLNREEQQLNRQNELQTQKLNNSIEQFRQQARAQAQNRFIDTTLSLAEMERKYDQEVEMMEIQAEMEANQANVDPQTKAQIKDLNMELYRSIKQEQDLQAAADILSQQDLSDERKNQLLRQIGERYGVTGDGGPLQGLSNEKVMNRINERLEDVKRRINDLRDDRRKMPYIPQNTMVNPVNIQSDLRGGQQNQGQQAQGQQAQPETPSTPGEQSGSDDSEEEFHSLFGNVNM